MINKITKPTLVIDKKKCLNNIERMAAKAKVNKVIFRPHFKTHHLAEVGSWFTDFGVKAITVSSVSMAEYFFKNGWKDITIAFPVNIREIERINYLAGNAEINLLLISRETISFLNKNLKSKVGVFVKIDTGLGRTGINVKDIDQLDLLLEEINKSSMLEFNGFLTHTGHTYTAKSINEVENINSESNLQLSLLKKRYSSLFNNIIISVGDTPSCSLATDFTDVDEIRPGNFVYYDIMQYNIGSCTINDIAVTVACPVVGKEASRNEIFIYGGAIHLSKDYLVSKSGFSYYGMVVRFNPDGWSGPLENTYLARLSQEHGIIKTTPQYFESFNAGDLTGIFPVHSCLTANLLREDYIII